MSTTSSTRMRHALAVLAATALLIAAQPVSAVPPGGAVDKQAPVTQALGVPASGWASGDVTVTLSATDLGTGVAYTRFTVNGSAPQTYSAPLAFSAEGTTTLRFWSADKASPANVETTKTVYVRIDRVTPTLKLAGLGVRDVAATVTASAIDTLSGIATLEGRADGRGLFRAGSSLSFSIPGTHTVEFRVADKAGNSVLATGTVIVRSASTLSARGPAAAIVYPRSASVAGTLSVLPTYRLSHYHIRLEALSGTRWVPIVGSEATASAAGTFTAVFVPRSNLTVRAVFAGDELVARSVSPAIAIKVKAPVTLKAPTSARAGVAFTASVTIKPAHGVVTLTVQRKVSGVWKLYKRVAIKTPLGAGSARVALPRGAYRLVASHVDAGHVASASRAVLVSVR